MDEKDVASSKHASTRADTDDAYSATSNAKKVGALAALIVQNTALVLVSKFSFSRGERVAPYLVSTVVACSETLKLVASVALLAHTHGKGAVVSAMRDARPNGARLALPSALYVLQNNLLFKAVRMLSPTTYAVCAQSKILTSALCSVWLLHSKITRRQCFALATLVAGMVLVRASETNHRGRGARIGASSRDGDASRGLFALFAAAFISGFTGAYLEKIYTSSDDASVESHSVWFRNAQLACFSVPIAVMSAYWRDGARIDRGGFFQGYDVVVAIVVVLQATGGLVVGIVMRHAGNILKCFAVSISMCNGAVFTRVTSPEQTSASTLATGLALVVAATFAYSA